MVIVSSARRSDGRRVRGRTMLRLPGLLSGGLPRAAPVEPARAGAASDAERPSRRRARSGNGQRQRRRAARRAQGEPAARAAESGQQSERRPDGQERAAVSERPVLLVHGWGSSFERTWVATGVSALLEDAGRTVIGVDLLGHGDAPKPHDPGGLRRPHRAARRGPAGRRDRSTPSASRSAPARCWSWRAASRSASAASCSPASATNVFARDEDETDRLIAGVRGEAPDSDVRAQVFRHYADQPGNDPEALAAVLRAPAPRPFTEAELAAVTCPVLVVLGDRTSPARATAWSAALPDARLVVAPQRRPLRHAGVVRLHRRHARVPRRRPRR